MSTRSRRVLLVSPPWLSPRAVSLGVATLRPLLIQAGIATDELYGSMLFPYAERDGFLSASIRSDLSPPVDGSGSFSAFMDLFSAHLFAPALYPAMSDEVAVEGLFRHLLQVVNLEGVITPATTFDDLGGRNGSQWRAALEDVARARTCVDRCVERADRAEYDVIGLSVTFENQLPAALVIAQRLKERRPERWVIMGGAACFGRSAEGLLASFPALDAVCHGEGERVIVPLVEALRAGTALDRVEGIAYRDAGGAVRRTEPPPSMTDLDELPLPDFDGFFRQLEKSEWARGPAELYFETSRGCWWGQKHRCTFCGLSADTLRFRRKSPDRALAEIRYLYERYPRAELLWATDLIFDLRYFDDLLPRLAAFEELPGRPLRIFYETKSNLVRDQLERLAAAHVTCLQPGIESLSDGVLRVMNKGVTALGQIQFIKWAHEVGLNRPQQPPRDGPSEAGFGYALIVRNPGERAEDYREMADLVPYLEHLPPPATVWPMQLQRFSPYFSEPERYGITNVRPRTYYRDIYPDPGVQLERIAYHFDFDHALFGDADLLSCTRELMRAVVRWAAAWQCTLLLYQDLGDRLLVREERDGVECSMSVAGVGAAVFRHLDRARSKAAVLRRFERTDPAVLECLLLTWQHRRWVYRDARDRVMALVPCKGPRRKRALTVRTTGVARARVG